MTAPLHYADFRTGLTFTDVRRMLAVDQHRAKLNRDRLYISRGPVLWRFHCIKTQMYDYYLARLEDEDDGLPY